MTYPKTEYSITRRTAHTTAQGAKTDTFLGQVVTTIQGIFSAGIPSDIDTLFAQVQQTYSNATLLPANEHYYYEWSESDQTYVLVCSGVPVIQIPDAGEANNPVLFQWETTVKGPFS